MELRGTGGADGGILQRRINLRHDSGGQVRFAPTGRDTPTGLQIRKPKHEAPKELIAKDLKAQNMQIRTY